MVQIVSYYTFAAVGDPDALCAQQRALCAALNLAGRIYIAEEGINGTCAGRPEDVEAYQQELRRVPGFETINVKVEAADRVPFADLRVRTRPYLVNLGEGNDVDPRTEGGERLAPAQWKAFFESGREFTLLDVRNQYEGQIGHFEGAKLPPYRYFHEFPQWVDDLDLDPEEPVLMYCTGGIRCEKFSGLLKRKGVQKVYQLDGGILGYAAQVGGDHFCGDVFVFDDRMSVDIGGGPTPGRCLHCGEPTVRLINCANVDCHQLHLSCDACVRAMRACCCVDCQSAPRVRVFDESHLQHPWRKLHSERTASSKDTASSVCASDAS